MRENGGRTLRDEVRCAAALTLTNAIILGDTDD